MWNFRSCAYGKKLKPGFGAERRIPVFHFLRSATCYLSPLLPCCVFWRITAPVSPGCCRGGFPDMKKIGMCHLSRRLHTLPLQAIMRGLGACGRKLIAVNEVESNPLVQCNLPDGTFDSMLSDFHVAPAALSSLQYYLLRNWKNNLPIYIRIIHFLIHIIIFKTPSSKKIFYHTFCHH